MFKTVLFSKRVLHLSHLAFANHTILGLQQEQHEIYQTLVKVLNAEEEQVVQGVFAMADSINAQQTPQVNGGPH